MKRQQSLDTFFKIKAKPDLGGLSTQNSVKKLHMDNEKGARKRSLSLQRKNTPNKSPKTKTTPVVHHPSNDNENSPQNSDLSPGSDSTIIYSPPLFVKTPNKNITPKSGRKSDNKLFSPERKRRIFKRSPKAVRNLTSELNNEVIHEYEVLNNACEGYNDTTIFFLKIVHKFLKNESLKKLIDEKEQQLLSQCFEVMKPGMLLICRLYWHLDRWQKWEKLLKVTSSFKQIDSVNMNQVVDSLVEYGFLMRADNEGNKINFDELVNILKHEELKKIGKDLLRKNFKTKEETIEALRSFSKVTVNMSMFLKGSSSNNMSRLMKIMSAAAGPCYRLTQFARTALYKLYLLSFLGMDYSVIRDKTLELVLMNDKINAETYPIDKSMEIDDASVVFRHKDDFDKYLTAHYIYEDYLQMTDTTKKCKLVEQVYEMYQNISEEDVNSYKALPAWLRRFTPANMYINILTQGITELKRLKSDIHYQLCLDILSTLLSQNAFRQYKREHLYSEKALVLFTMKRYDEAAQTLLDGFDSSLPPESKDALRPRAKKIASQKNITVSDELRCRLMQHACKDDMLESNLHGEHIFKNRVEKSSARGKVKFISKTEEGLIEQDAERCCISHYVDDTREYTHGEHWEGRIINSIFFLLFWDIIFHRLPGCRGIYLSYFQKYPLDMFTESFYANRKSLIEDRLKEIEGWSAEQLIEFMHQRYMSRPETDVSGVTAIPWQSLRAVASCLGCRASVVCRLLAVDYRRWHAGFPDLTLWHEGTGRIKFVEVKTDTDKPSMKQIQWMHYLRQYNIDTEFCYIGTNTTRCKARGVPIKKEEPQNTQQTNIEDKGPENLNNTSVIDVQSNDSDDFESNETFERRKSAAENKKVKPKTKVKKRKSKKDEVENSKHDGSFQEIKKETDVDDAREKKSKSACPIAFEDDLDDVLSQETREVLDVIVIE